MRNGVQVIFRLVQIDREILFEPVPKWRRRRGRRYRSKALAGWAAAACGNVGSGRRGAVAAPACVPGLPGLSDSRVANRLAGLGVEQHFANVLGFDDFHAERRLRRRDVLLDRGQQAADRRRLLLFGLFADLLFLRLFLSPSESRSSTVNSAVLAASSSSGLRGIRLISPICSASDQLAGLLGREQQRNGLGDRVLVAAVARALNGLVDGEDANVLQNDFRLGGVDAVVRCRACTKSLHVDAVARAEQTGGALVGVDVDRVQADALGDRA